MYPVLFHIRPITLYSFGLMMATAFLVANYFFTSEIRRRGFDPRMAGQITMICLVGGIAGSKLFSILENWSDFMHDPTANSSLLPGLRFTEVFSFVRYGSTS